MRFLLDTHVFLWLLSDRRRISASTRDLLADPANSRLLSAASVWELAIKHGLGRLVLPGHLAEVVRAGLLDTVTSELFVTTSHALAVSQLPDHHRDPFDRLLVAQAQVERLTLVTADPQVRQYDVATLPA